MPRLHRVILSALGLCAAPALAPAQATATLAPGIVHETIARAAGPWQLHVVRVDLRKSGAEIRQLRAHDQLGSRERTSEMAARLSARGERAVVAVNADFFDLATGVNENNQVIGSEWWHGVRVTESPFDTYDNVHAQFALDARGTPSIDRWRFDGWVQVAGLSMPLIALNRLPRGAYEGTALYTPRMGATTPTPTVPAGDTARSIAEVTLTAAGHRGDTLLYLRGPVRRSAGTPIPADGAVLSAYGARIAALAAGAERDTVRVVLGARRLDDAAPLEQPKLLVGGWPRILRDGVNVAPRAAGDEGTISRNAEARHPRTAIAISKDRRTLWLVTVDGRQKDSVGMTLTELADFLRSLGAWQALNFDGGGSTTMVIDGAVVNRPSDATGERAVGNAVAIVVPRR